MSLTTSDKQFISDLVLGESARLEARLTADLSSNLTSNLTASLTTDLTTSLTTSLTTTLTETLTTTLSAIIYSESSRLEAIMEDDRQVLNTCLDMLNGNLVAVGTVNEHGERIYTIERTQRSLVTTVGKHSKALKKLVPSGA